MRVLQCSQEGITQKAPIGDSMLCKRISNVDNERAKHLGAFSQCRELGELKLGQNFINQVLRSSKLI